MTITKAKRHYGLDLLRVIATYMVIQIHTGEFYYIGQEGTVLNTPQSHWVGWCNSLFRSCVPLFVMLSGFFLFPITDATAFYKKRLSRVVVPFLIWCVLYAFYQYFMGKVDLNTALINILKIPINFGTQIGHLWFVYMLIGIYLFAPILSPWIQTTSRRNIELYLLVWGISLTVPYVHQFFPEVLGEAYWNQTPLLYYFSGFLGYVILSFYIKHFLFLNRAWCCTVGLALIITGYVITAYGFIHRLPFEKSVIRLELTWGFETINVAMMAAGIFLLLKDITNSNVSSFFNSLLLDVSAKSYGIYLAHIIVLNTCYELLEKQLGSMFMKVPIIAASTFISTYLLIKLLSFIPKGKWLVG